MPNKVYGPIVLLKDCGGAQKFVCVCVFELVGVDSLSLAMALLPLIGCYVLPFIGWRPFGDSAGITGFSVVSSWQVRYNLY